MWRAGRGIALAALVGLAGASATGAEGAGPTRTTAGLPGGWKETSPGFVVPDDPLLREQWWLFNFGQTIGGQVKGAPGADIRAPEAWAVTTGSAEVVVAVLDFGIDYEHPDLDGQVFVNEGESGEGREDNGVDDDGNGYVDDWRGWDFVDEDNDATDTDGHGTFVSGVVAAKGGDGFGVTGVAPGVRVLPLRVGDTGVDQSLTPRAIEYAAQMGARVAVQSYTTEPSGLFDQSAAETAAMVAHPEILFVTGAGNDGNDYRGFEGRTGLKPCNNPTVSNLICVAGTDRNDEPWEESTFGEGRVHLAAPAESLLLVARPRSAVATETFDDAAAWAVVDDMPGFWAPTGPQPEVTFADGSLHVVHDPGDGVASVGVLRRGELLDVTGHEGCSLDASLAGTVTGQARVSFGLFRAADQRRNAFGGELVVTRTELEDSNGDPVGVSMPVRASEPLELAMRVETTQFDTNTIDVSVDELAIECWNAEHGDRDYEYWAGTSFATPLTAGVAALVASAHPDLDPLAVRRAILESVVELPALDGLVETGGRLDAFGALERAAELASGGASAADGTGEDEVAAVRTHGGAPVSFGPHDDYEMPRPGEEQGIPAGRGDPDPASPDEQPAPTGGAAGSSDDGDDDNDDETLLQRLIGAIAAGIAAAAAWVFRNPHPPDPKPARETGADPLDPAWDAYEANQKSRQQHQTVLMAALVVAITAALVTTLSPAAFPVTMPIMLVAFAVAVLAGITTPAPTEAPPSQVLSTTGDYPFPAQNDELY